MTSLDKALKIADELAKEHGWSSELPEEFFAAIVDAGFNSTTIKQAFVLADIVETLGTLGPITLRGAFYRAVSAGIFPDTAEKHYRAAGSIILKLRRRWCVGYDKVVDSSRTRHKSAAWSGLADFVKCAQEQYRLDLWSRQKECVEVFVEKDAMSSVIKPVTDEYSISLNIIRGQISESFVWDCAANWKATPKPIVAYYLGDHDPSGLAIEATLRKKLAGFYEKPFRWERIAITEADFNRQDLKGFPIKGTRSSKRWKTMHRDYLDRFGDRCVEVDAIHPNEIRDRVRAAIESNIDQAEWQRLQAIEAVERDSFQQFVLALKPGGEAA